MSEATPALEIAGISKEFVGVRALTDASLTCQPGEVHALVGENGAGKSTLIKVAAGALRPDSGSVKIAGQDLHPVTPLAARRLGLLTAYQDTSLVPGLSVAENVILSFHGTRDHGLTMDADMAAELLEPFDLPFSPGDQVGALTPGSRQLLEIARAMIARPKVLLLDEPTAALDASSIAGLERMIEQSRGHGTAILYISHRLDEVQRIAERVTVIRDGRIQGTYDRQDWDVDTIVELMVGEATDLAFPTKTPVPADAPVAIATKRLHGNGFGPVDIYARKGEIVGIAGAEGNGQHQLVRTLVGLRRAKGQVEVDGQPAKINTPNSAISRGIIFQSGDRAAESIFKELSVMENSTLAAKQDVGPLGTVMRSRQRSIFEPLAGRLGITKASDFQPAGQLSGGNQQKTVLARALAGEASILVCDEPTAGVDARARLDLYRALREQADAGTAIIMNSSDAGELVGMCDRIYVISRGRVVGELADEGMQQSKVVSSFVNVDPDAVAQSARARTAEAGSFAKTTRSVLSSGWTPLAILVLLILGVGAYTAARSSVFLGSANLNSLLVLALPLAILAVGQQALLIAGGFDISVGSAMSLTVVLASFVVTSESLGGSLPGILLCLAVGVVIGLGNASIVRILGVNPIITTIATLGILQGIALLLRPSPEGVIGSWLTEAVTDKIGFIPIGFIVVAIVAIVAEAALRLTHLGLTIRGTGLAEESARRTGVKIEAVKFGSYIFCAVAAVVAGLVLASQVGIGEATVGSSYPLTAFTACFLGGAVLTGGRGSFVGALLGAIFLSMLINVTPLLALQTAWSQTATGVLTVLAVLAYSLGGRTSVSAASEDDFDLEGPPDPVQQVRTTPEVNL
jgi:ribose transport system ATP-binding protein